MSAAPIYSGAWPLSDWYGTVPSSADTSLTAPSNVTIIGTVGASTKLVQPGGLQYVVTTSFTIPSLGSTVSVVIGTNSLVVGDYIWINEGSHGFFGHVTAAGTTITVKADQVNIGAVGDTVAAGAVVQRCGPIASDRVKIEQIRLTQIGTTSGAGYVNLFTYDGANYNFFDAFVYAGLSLSTTVQLDPVDHFYGNLQLSAGHSLRVADTVGGAHFRVTALGAYT